MGLTSKELIGKTTQEKIGIWYLFSTFLRIGMVAFDGHMAGGILEQNP
ncbi:hypothetical protein [Olivibacter sitiensis]|nr:hypothetical protein [Olivibacter sitiensis]